MLVIITTSIIYIRYFNSREKIIYIYNAFGSGEDLSVKIPLGKGYACETLESSEKIYYGEEKKNIADTKEFSFNIRYEDNYKVLELKVSPIGGSRILPGVKYWSTTLICIHKDFGGFGYLFE